MSVIYIPYLGEIYFAIRNFGSFLNGQKIFVSNRPIEQCVVSFGDYPHNNESICQHELIKNLYNKIAKVRFFGAACIDFSFIASGRTDAVVIGTRKPWDIKPGLLLASEAGAVITNLYGEKHTNNDYFTVISSTSEIQKILCKKR